jgi:hypothetical protein
MLLRNIIISLLPLFIYGRKAAFQQELKRQYNDFLNTFKKVETPSSFETFVYNLNTIENFNEVNNGCRMYLTQHSDTFENEYLHKKCKYENIN